LSRGPAEYFTGAVRRDPLVEAPAPARVNAVSVTFEHGAAPTTAMTHIAIHEAEGGKAVDWLEHVTDRDYDG